MKPPDSIQELADPVVRLLDDARAGDRQALGQLWEFCRAYLVQVANAELNPQLQAKVGGSDLVQETFLEAQRIFSRFDGASQAQLRAWLRAILLNKMATCARYFQAARRRATQEVGFDSGSDRQAEPADSQPGPSSIFVRQERVLDLTAALDRLPEHYRQVLVWRQIEDLSFEEMAQRLGRSVEAVRKLWLRAVQQLQEELGDSI
jgi:RNA polymerase sigma-70 factor (ECF subfamily)